jgi:hypothetical protein
MSSRHVPESCSVLRGRGLVEIRSIDDSDSPPEARLLRFPGLSPLIETGFRHEGTRLDPSPDWNFSRLVQVWGGVRRPAPTAGINRQGGCAIRGNSKRLQGGLLFLLDVE